MAFNRLVTLCLLHLVGLVYAQTTLKVVEKTSFPFPTPGNTQEFEIAGTGTDGATTLLDRIIVSEYLVIDNSQSTPFISTATAASTFTQTVVAAGTTGYQIIYAPEDKGAVALVQSCSVGSDKGECVEKDWVVGGSATTTVTTTFTGRIVPYWTITSLASAAPSPTTPPTSPTSPTSSGNKNSGVATAPLRWFTFLSLCSGIFVMI